MFFFGFLLVFHDWLAWVKYGDYSKTNPISGLSSLELNWYPRLSLERPLNWRFIHVYMYWRDVRYCCEITSMTIGCLLV